MSSSPVKTTKPGLESQEAQIIDEICDYAERHQVKEMLEEYMRRLILEQPKEPLKFLMQEITERPFVTGVKSHEAGSTEERK